MRNQPGVLIVEDEPAIAELIAVNLRHNGFRPTWAMDSASAQRELDAVLPDVILLDWMLPGESGLVLAKRWRANPRTKQIPIIKRAFSPTIEEISWAKRVIAADNASNGQAVKVDGKMVDRPVVMLAHRILRLAGNP